MTFDKNKFWNDYITNPDESIIYLYKNSKGSIFRYRDFNPNNISALSKGRLYLSSPNKFNDPWDCNVDFSIDDFKSSFENMGFLKEIESKLGLDINSLSEDFKTKIIEECLRAEKNVNDEKVLIEQDLSKKHTDYIKDTVKVACFSEVNNSILMWSHYADCHKGFCLEYDIEELKMYNDIFSFIYPIKYSNVPAEICASFEPEKADNLTIYATMCKSSHWEYEREWRLVLPESLMIEDVENKGIFYVEIPKPKKIYLGALTSEENEDIVRKIYKDEAVDIIKMKMNRNDYI